MDMYILHERNTTITTVVQKNSSSSSNELDRVGQHHIYIFKDIALLCLCFELVVVIAWF